MSKGRVFSRPRTKVYDTNYHIGESYYRPALEKLDRKYGGRGFGDFDRGTFANGDASGRAPSLLPADLASPRVREVEDEFCGERRRHNSALLGEYNAIFEGRMRNGVAPPRGGRSLDDEIEEDLTSSMKRLRVKSARSIAEEFVEDVESAFGRREGRRKLDFGEKVLESVGLTGRARQALEEEGTTGRRRFLKTTSEGGEGDDMTKWTALKPLGFDRRSFFDEEDESAGGAASRARKSRARLEDLESEMQAISEKSAAREKRVRDLKALVQENEASALDNLQTSVRVKSSIQSEKKTVTF